LFEPLCLSGGRRNQKKYINRRPQEIEGFENADRCTQPHLYQFSLADWLEPTASFIVSHSFQLLIGHGYLSSSEEQPASFQRESSMLLMVCSNIALQWIIMPMVYQPNK